MDNNELISSDERINEYRDNVAIRNMDIATKGAFVISVCMLIISLFLDPVSIQTILLIFYTMLITFTVFGAERVLGYALKSTVAYIGILALTVTIPILWINSGGHSGATGIWMIFLAAYICYATTGIRRQIALIMLLIVVMLSMTVSLIRPDFVAYLPARSNKILMCGSIIAVSLYILIIGNMQIKIGTDAVVDIAVMQDDLSAQNQELIAVNDELVEMTERLKNNNDTQRQFTASMNHELRAPLNGIEGCLQILLMSDELTPENEETVRNALVASKTMNQTVNDLLDFAKLEEGKFEIVKRYFDLRDMLENVITIFSPQACGKGLRFVVRAPISTRVSIYADQIRIQQVMNNLISNGIKYTREGSVTMEVMTSSCALEFSVTDTGTGMKPEELAVLFEPFTRFNMNENVLIQGTGLGMNIVSKLVKQMNGEITVDSKVGVGTSFKVSIPVVYYDVSKTFEQSKEKRTIAKKSSIEGVRILSVDDRAINRAVIKGLLKNDNTLLDEADSGKAAFEKCRDIKYDVILMDHMMPEMDGIETMELIHSEGINQETPVIMLTGNLGDEYVRLYMEHGAMAYLPKPVMYIDLIDAIKKCK